MKILKTMKKAICTILALSLLGALVPSAGIASDNSDTTAYEAVDGTTGAPLGGFGAGAVKYNAMTGKFAAMTMAPADQNDYAVVGSSCFQLYTKVKDTIKTVDTLTAPTNDGRYTDDAIWPEHKVDFGETNGINVSMKAFSPLDTENYDNMSMPYAFYEMTFTNNNSSEAEAAAALLWDITSGSSEYVDGKGFTSKKWAVFGDGGIISAGNDSGFFTSGVCSDSVSGTKNRTAIKVSLAANETKTIRFVLAWYDNSDPDGAYYLSKYSNPADIAELGLANFDTLSANADKLVNTMRASNIPSWYMNQCLESLANISNNSIYKTDGRTAFAEGEWTCFGTMDQMWHARQIMGALIPELAWQELEYWARTQRNDGQIHHDFNYMTDTSIKYKLVPWDDTEHSDYRNVDAWVDLNCGFIISVYEMYQQTGDEEKLSYFWPYMKKAGDRIFAQVAKYGDPQYPYVFLNSQNSYDAGGDPNAFNTSISAVAYKVMKLLSDKNGESELSAKYQTAYDTVVEGYRNKYIKNGFPTGRISESYFAGQWLAMNLKLGEIWTADETDYVIDCLDDYYHPLYKTLGYSSGTYDEWTPYILSHYGGLLLNTRRQNQYEAMQKDSYNRQFKNRNYVFNHPLDILPSVTTANYAATSISGDKQYISIPTIWRNYYDVIGYHRNAASKELWLEPILLPEMDHVMTNAAYVSPEGYGTISCTETATDGSSAYQNKNITFKPESDTYVSTLYLEDNFGDNISVTIDGVAYSFERIGEGYTKELAVEYNGMVTSEGINIVTSGDPGSEPPADPEKPDDIDAPPITAEMSAFETINASKYTATGGVSIAEENGIKYITDCDDQDYVKYDGIGFEDGAKSISLTVRSNKASHIELALGLVSGETLQSLEIPNTSGEWQTIKYDLETAISDTQNVILRFRTNDNESADLLDLADFVFDYRYQLPKADWSASASYNSKYASNAFDRDPASRWNSSYQTGNEWYLLDLGSVCEFNKIALDNSKDYPRWYEVYVSDDGINFGNAIASGEGESGTTEITFERQNARYIKICQTGSAPSNYWSIYELYVYNTDEDFGSGISTPTPTPIPDKTINEYTYTGTSASHSTGTNYFDVSKYNTGTKNARSNTVDTVFRFADGVSDTVRAEFADSTDDSVISSTYTGSMVNYIGTGTKPDEYTIKPAITGVELPAGEYTLYYIGGNSNDVTVSFENDSSANITRTGKYSFATSKLIMHEYDIKLSEAYKGDITFFNSEKWLPDLYAVKLVSKDAESATAEPATTPTAPVDTTAPSETVAPSETAVPSDTEAPSETVPPENTSGILDFGFTKTSASEIEAAVNNDLDSDITVQFILASYDENNSLKSIVLADTLTVKSGESQILPITLPTDDNYVIMAWDSLKGMKPLMTPINSSEFPFDAE